MIISRLPLITLLFIKRPRLVGIKVLLLLVMQVSRKSLNQLTFGYPMLILLLMLPSLLNSIKIPMTNKLVSVNYQLSLLFLKF